MLNPFKKWIFGSEDSSGGTVMEQAAGRFRDWVVSSAGEGTLQSADLVLSQYRDEKGDVPLPESLAADASAFLGEWLLGEWGSGRWEEHQVYGLIVQGVGGVQRAKIPVLAVIERKWVKGNTFSLAEYAESLKRRIETEKGVDRPGASKKQILSKVIGLSGQTAQGEANRQAESFRLWWRSTRRADLPLSLNGVRLLDGFLRSHYLANFLEEGELVQAGFFVGEVARGLFGGAWDFSGMESIEKAALVYPEINYYPIGRIYKMMTERPEGEALDEYIRLVPVARRELRERESI